MITIQVVDYYRVSTVSQGKSGLGIDSQQNAVRAFCESEGIELISECMEIETVKGSNALGRVDI